MSINEADEILEENLRLDKKEKIRNIKVFLILFFLLISIFSLGFFSNKIKEKNSHNEKMEYSLNACGIDNATNLLEKCCLNCAYYYNIGFDMPGKKCLCNNGIEIKIS